MDQQNTTASELPKAPPPPEQDSYDKSGTNSVPTGEWPGAFGLYKYSKQAIKNNLGTVLTLILAYIGLSLVLSFFDTLGQIVGYIMAILFEVTLIVIYLATSRGQKISLGQSLKSSKPMLLLKYFINSIAVGLALLVSLVLFVVPFFFVLPRVVLAPYFLIDKGMGPFKAISTSWSTTKGHSGKIWGIIGATIVMALPMITIIGIPVAIYFLFMYQAATSLAYLYITKQSGSSAI